MVDLQNNDIRLGAKPALIVVDMINGFTDPECPLGSESSAVIKANVCLLAAFRERELPVFFTTVVYHNDEDASVFRGKVPALNVLKPDSHWVKLHPDMQRRPSELLIEKQWASSFHKTILDAELKQRQVDSLVVTGLTTSGCVRATAVDGLQYNYSVVVAKDAVGDRNPEAHAASLFDLGAKYTGVESSDDIIVSLADH